MYTQHSTVCRWHWTSCMQWSSTWSFLSCIFKLSQFRIAYQTFTNIELDQRSWRITFVKDTLLKVSLLLFQLFSSQLSCPDSRAHNTKSFSLSRAHNTKSTVNDWNFLPEATHHKHQRHTTLQVCSDKLHLSVYCIKQPTRITSVHVHTHPGGGHSHMPGRPMCGHDPQSRGLTD